MSVEVGTAYVSVIPGARGFAKKLQQELAKEFRGFDLDKLVADAVSGGRPIRVQVQPEVDPSRVDPADVPVDADGDGFLREVQRLVNEVERSVKAHVKVEVDADDKRGLGGLASAGKSALSALVPDGLLSKIKDLGTAIQDVAGSSTKMGGNLVGAMTTASGPAGAAVGAILALAAAAYAAQAAAIFAVPAITALAGAVAAIPGIAVGAGAAIGTLALGFKGISDAFKDKPSGGGGGAGADLAAQARQVAQATRGVEGAQRSLIRAQRDVVNAERAVISAIREETERREDLGRAVRGASLDQEEAALRVLEAERELNEARETGNLPDIQRAELAYRQAQLNVENTTDATADLTAEQAAATKTTVKGSEAVQQAMQRQMDATDGVKAATDQLTAARESLNAAQNPPKSGGGGGITADLIKLAPAAQKFVDAIKALRPAFERLRLGVQQRLFEGLDKTVTKLGEAWIPQLKITLGRYADTFNGFFKNLGKTLTKPKVIDDFAAGAEAARVAFDKIGTAISGPLVEAFGSLSNAAAPFIKVLGEEIAGIVTKFSAWVKAGERSGALQEFFDNASVAMKDIFAIGGSVASIIGSLVEIIAGKKIGTTEKSPIQQFRDGLKGLAEFLNDPKNQQKVRDFITKVEDAIVKLGDAVDTISGAITKVDGWITKVEGWATSIENFKNRVTGAFTSVSTKVSAAMTAVTTRFGTARTTLATMAEQVRARVVGAFTRLTEGAGGRIEALRTKVAGIPGKVVAALGKTGSMLYNAGRNIVQGLMGGIASLGSWLKQQVSTFIEQHVPVAIRSALGIASPSKVAAELGRRVPEGLALGITSGSGLVENAASRMADAALPSLLPSPVRNPAGGLNAAAGVGGIEAYWARGSSGDPVLDALRENIKFRYRGDVTAALASR